MPKGQTSRPTKRKNKPGTDSFASVNRVVNQQAREEGNRLGRAGLDAPGLRKRERIKRK